MRMSPETIENSNIECIISECSKKPQMIEFLEHRIKNSQLHFSQPRIDSKLQQHSISKDSIQEIRLLVQKIDIKKVILKNAFLKDSKALHDIRGSHGLACYQTPQGKISSKNLSNFFTAGRKTRENIPTISDFSVTLGSPSCKNLVKMKSETNLPIEACKNKTCVQPTVPIKRVNIGKVSLKAN